MTAQDIRSLKKVTYQLVEAEERSVHLRNLISRGVGFREEEEFLEKERKKTKGGGGFDKRKEIVILVMREKRKDNLKFEGKLRRLKTKLISRIGETEVLRTWRMRGIMRDMRNGAKVMRMRAREKFKKKENFLITKYGGKKEMRDELTNLDKEDRMRYEDCMIFTEGKVWQAEDMKDPCVVM